MKFSAILFAALVSLATAAPVGSAQDPEVPNEQIRQFTDEVGKAAREGSDIMNEYPLPVPKSAATKVVDKVLSDRNQVRRYEVDIRASLRDQEDFFYNTYTQRLTRDELKDRMEVEDKAKAELNGMQSWSSGDMSTTLTPALFDLELKEYVQTAKDQAGMVANMEKWGTQHTGILDTRKTFYARLSNGSKASASGLSAKDNVFVEEQRVKAYERMSERYKNFSAQNGAKAGDNKGVASLAKALPV